MTVGASILPFCRAKPSIDRSVLLPLPCGVEVDVAGILLGFEAFQAHAGGHRFLLGQIRHGHNFALAARRAPELGAL